MRDNEESETILHCLQQRLNIFFCRIKRGHKTNFIFSFIPEIKEVRLDVYKRQADCTSLEIGEHEDKKAGVVYENLLYQIRPAFGGNIVATIVNPEHRPQMATVREGVMKKEILNDKYQGEVINHDVAKYVPTTDLSLIHIWGIV